MTSPETFHSQSVADEPLHWFALSVRNNKVLDARERLAPLCADTYVPLTVRVDPKGRRTEVPAVSRLLFVRTTAGELLELERVSGQGTIPAFFIYRDTTRRAPQVIPEGQMRMFMLVSSAGEADLVYLDSVPANYQAGQRVRVIEGVFKGAEGRVRRVRRDRRVVVEIAGVCAVALPFLHHSFLQIIEE